GIEQAWGGTFHAVANRLLRKFGRAMGLSPDFTIMDVGDAADMMNLIRGELGVAKKDRRFPRKQTLVRIYSCTVNAQQKLRDVLEKQFPWCTQDIDGIASIFEAYSKRKIARQVLDYDDLLHYWKALAESDGVGEKLAEMFDHILVDEYQDTNAVQSDILRALRRKRHNIMVVGDDAQSIYSFRAATIRNILDFPDQFPGTTTVTLEQNYRSTQPILNASNAVMQFAKQRYTKNLWSSRRSQQKPVLYTCRDEEQQTQLVCENILAHLEQGTPLRQQAVLFRTGHHSAALEIELSRRNIPFHKFGGLKFIEAAHIKDMLAILRIVENPYDEISWFRVLHLLDGVGPKTAQRVIESLGIRVANSGDATESPLRRLADDPPPVPPAARESFAELRGVLLKCRGIDSDSSESHEPSLPVQVERVRDFYDPICKRIHDNAPMRLRDIEQLENIAAGYSSRSRFISDLTLDPPTATSDLAQPPFLEEDYLILSTIHSAKGCEWTVVHIIHAADGNIPSDMAVGDEAGVDEERRIFYVAMTRAKDYLYTYFPLRYYHRRFGLNDSHHYAQLTRYLPASIHDLFEQRAIGLIRDEDVEDIADAGDVQSRLSELWRE
ncbi:MAG: ATP-dependent helicase, partial [Planctomycetes bacterium]|nr:ATP-dependent helicase [Planctomycetota bacterium]